MKQIIDIFTELKAAKTREDKIRIMRENAKNEPLAYLFHMAYTPLHRPFTDVVPAYKKDDAPEGLSYTTIIAEYKRFYIFERNSSVAETRKMEILVQMLEALGKESEILEQAIRGRLDDLPQDVVVEAFGLHQPNSVVA